MLHLNVQTCVFSLYHKNTGKQPTSLKAQPILRLCIHSDEDDVGEE